MLGDFQYCSSSEDSNSDSDSDSSSKSEECLEKLYAEKRKVSEKISSCQKNLKIIHSALKSLNEERNKLLLLRNELISSSCFNDEHSTTDDGNKSANGEENQIHSGENEKMVKSRNSVAQNSNFQPLNLEIPPFSGNNDEEEFDSD